MNSQSLPTKLVLEEYLCGEQLFTHALQVQLYDEEPVEVFLVNGKECDMLSWLANLQHARRSHKKDFLAVQNSQLATRTEVI